MDNQTVLADSGADLGTSESLSPKVRTTKPRRGQGRLATHGASAASSEVGLRVQHSLQVRAADLASICDSLKSLQVRRRHLIRSKDRNRLALGSLVRRHLGWRADLPEKQREEIRKRASDMIDRAIAGEKFVGEDEWIREFAFDCETSCAPFDNRLKTVEKSMEAFAKQLPATQWVEGVRGFGLKTLAIIVGEAGDLGGYSNPGKLWKRLGLAPKDTYVQADNGAHMVPRQRRAEMWACLGDSLLRGNKDIYKEAYDRKKAEYLERAKTEPAWQNKGGAPSPIHAHKAAHRFMEKLALKHLWQAWRGQTIGDVQISVAPPIHSPNGDGSAIPSVDNQPGAADPTNPPEVAGAGHLKGATQDTHASASKPKARKGRASHWHSEPQAGIAGAISPRKGRRKTRSALTSHGRPSSAEST